MHTSTSTNVDTNLKSQAKATATRTAACSTKATSSWGEAHAALWHAKPPASAFVTRPLWRQTFRHRQHLPGQHWLPEQRRQHGKTPALRLYHKRTPAVLEPPCKMQVTTGSLTSTTKFYLTVKQRRDQQNRSPFSRLLPKRLPAINTSIFHAEPPDTKHFPTALGAAFAYSPTLLPTRSGNEQREPASAHWLWTPPFCLAQTRKIGEMPFHTSETCNHYKPIE